MSRFAELADGRRLEFPDGTSDEVIQATVKRVLGQKAAGPTLDDRQARIASLEAERAEVESEPTGLLRGAAESVLGVGEAALELGTGAAVTALGGAAAIPVTVIEAFRGGEDPAGAGRAVIEQFQESTFQPRTEAGKRASEVIAGPLESFEQFADRIGEITGEADDTLGATAVKTAILGAPALFGLRRGGVTRKPPTKPTRRQQVAAAAAEKGYVTPPSVRGETGVRGIAEGVGGKAKTKQLAIEKNQKVTNNLASRAVGLPEGTPLSIDGLQGIRARAGQAFEAVRGVGRVITDTTFRRDLSAAISRFKSAAKDFPELAKSDVTKIVDSLRVEAFEAGSGIDAMTLLRNKADVAFKGGDKALGRSYRAASDAIESVIERHLGRGDSTALLEQFRVAREQIAQTYSVEEALRAGSQTVGDVNATNLATQLEKGIPLTGDLLTIAEFSNTFPGVSTVFKGTPQVISPVDVGVGLISGTAGAGVLGPAAIVPGLATAVVRPVLRRSALQGVAKPAGATTTPSAGAIIGGATSAAEAQQ